jgi:hypothetical protein
MNHCICCSVVLLSDQLITTVTIVSLRCKARLHHRRRVHLPHAPPVSSEFDSEWDRGKQARMAYTVYRIQKVALYQRHLHLSKYTWTVFSLHFDPKTLTLLTWGHMSASEFRTSKSLTFCNKYPMRRRRNCFKFFQQSWAGAGRWTLTLLQFFNVFVTDCVCHMSNLTSLTWSRNVKLLHFTCPKFGLLLTWLTWVSEGVCALYGTQTKRQEVVSKVQ